MFIIVDYTVQSSVRITKIVISIATSETRRRIRIRTIGAEKPTVEVEAVHFCFHPQSFSFLR
jgi:hypothetical protein